MRWKIFIALLLMMLLYSGCRKVTGKIEIKPDKIEFPASGEQKFHEVLCRRERGLENKYGSAPDTLYECRLELSVTERSNFRVTEVNFLFARLADGVEGIDNFHRKVL